MDDLSAAVRGDDGQLPRQAGAFPDLPGVHPAGVPLDGRPLRHDHRLLLDILRGGLPFRGQVRGLDGYEEGLPLGDIPVVARGLPPRGLRHRDLLVRRWRRYRGGPARGREGHCRGGRDSVLFRVAVPRVPRVPRIGRGRQLPRRHQGHGRVLPEEGPRVRDVGVQLGCVGGRARRPAHHSVAREVLRMGARLHHHRRRRIHLDVLLAVALHEAGAVEVRQRGRAQVHIAG